MEDCRLARPGKHLEIGPVEMLQEAEPRSPMAHTEPHSADVPSLQVFVADFLAQVNLTVDSLWFDAAGPVIVLDTVGGDTLERSWSVLKPVDA